MFHNNLFVKRFFTSFLDCEPFQSYFEGWGFVAVVGIFSFNCAINF